MSIKAIKYYVFYKLLSRIIAIQICVNRVNLRHNFAERL